MISSMRRRTKIILVGALIVWPFLQIGLITAQAQYFADGRPYCIEASGGHFGQYRPVVSLSELNGFTLSAPLVDSGGSMGLAQWTFHALLVVDTGSGMEWRNWSYWKRHFDWLTPEQAKAAGLYGPQCRPEFNFVLTLPLFAIW
jgi:hypothetical protein